MLPQKLSQLTTSCARIKIKTGKLDAIRDWQKELNRNSEEVLQSLRQEGVFIESVFLEQHGNDHYLIYFMKLESHEKARAAFKASKLAIDKYHAQFKADCFDEREELELLVDFTNLDF
jgi:hypothetical protein